MIETLTYMVYGIGSLAAAMLLFVVVQIYNTNKDFR